MYHERATALALGYKKYQAKHPCKHNHAAIRYTSSGVCVQCATENNRKSHAKFNKIRIQCKNDGRVDFYARVYPDAVEALRQMVDAYNLAMRPTLEVK